MLLSAGGIVALSAWQTVETLRQADSAKERKQGDATADKRTPVPVTTVNSSTDSGGFISQLAHRYTWPVIAICAANVSVCGAWQLPAAHAFLFRIFAFSYHGVFHKGRWHTLLTSIFSHSGGFHLAFNCIAFASVAPILVHVVGQRDFLAFYMGTGVLSSLSGIISQVALSRAEVRPNLKVRPSLGASGSVCGLFALTALLFPETRFQIIFLPFFHFSAETMLYGLVCFDLAGLVYGFVKGSSPLGHGAHLGGVLCGYLYFEHWLKHRNQVVKQVLARQGRLTR